MRNLSVRVVGPDTARTRAYKECLFRTITASVARDVRTRFTEIDDADLTFHLGGEPVLASGDVIDLSPSPTISDAVHTLESHSTYTDILVSGEPLPPDPRGKMARLDEDEYDFAVVASDDESVEKLRDFYGIPMDRVVRESEFLEDRTVLDDVSHALLVSPDGSTPLLVERAVAARVCVMFYIGDDAAGVLGKDRTVMCSSFDDFVERARTMAEDKLSSDAFEAKSLLWAFGEDAVVGRESRMWLGSLLRASVGDDLGLLDLGTGDERLMRMVKDAGSSEGRRPSGN